MAVVVLRDYQNDCIAAILEAEGRGQRRNLVVLFTGAGKTVIFGELTRRTPGRTLILAHTDELINQAVEKLLGIDPRMNIGIVKAERNDIHTRVVVSSVQTLARENRRKQLFRGKPFTRVIADEAHFSVARTWREIIEAAGCFDPDGPCLLGVTATPMRGDGVGLDAVFEGIPYQKDLWWGIQNQYLCDIRGKQITIDVDLDHVKTRGGDFADGDLGNAMEEAGAPEVIANAYLKEASGRKSLVFVPTVNMAMLTTRAMQSVGVKAKTVYGAMPLEERRETLAEFSAGSIDVLSNVGVLTHGYDEPSVTCILNARPTKSTGLFIQIAGRGTRKYPGKADLLLLDFVGNSDRHKLVTLNSLFGLPLSALKDGKKSVKTAVEEIEEAVAAINGSKFRAHDVDLFGAAQLRWIQTADGWVLPGGQGTDYSLTSKKLGPSVSGEDNVMWRLVALERGKRPIIIHEDRSLTFAMGTAEDVVRARLKAGGGSMSLVDPNAKWRVNAPSIKQLETLRNMHIPFNEQTITRGEASDLLTREFAKKRSMT